MTPVNQGSRGALVAWTVATTILFVTATIFAIYYYVEANRVSTEAVSTANKFKEVVTEAALSSDEVNQLKTLKGNDALGFNNSMTLLDVAMKQRDDLASLVSGGRPKFEQVIADANAMLKDVPAKAKAAGAEKLNDTSIKALVDSLTLQVTANGETIQRLTKERDDAQRAQKEAADQLAAARAAMDKQLADVRAGAQKETDESATYRSSKDAQVAQIETDYKTQLEAAQKAQQESQTQIGDLNRTIDQKQKEIQSLQSRLAGMRINVADPIARQADGRIVRIPGGDVVYIDLGEGDQISPGMTFQVFDKVTGVPPPGDASTDENLPRGKASIEVTRVGPTSSECRIIRIQPGQALTEGDLIVNLVYDRNTKYNFLVFGNFDLDRNNLPTPQDAEVIKRLVTQWGGRLTDKVNVNTDFVVLGVEPVVPTFTREELQDPVNQAKFDEARAALDAYDEVRRQAQEYNVPILNQNRFLYFVGYYELSKR